MNTSDICPFPRLTRGRCYHLLPSLLLDKVATRFDLTVVDPEQLKMDQAMSKAADKVFNLVGFFNDAPIYHDVLCFKPKNSRSNSGIDHATLKWLGWDAIMTAETAKQAMNQGDKRIESIQLHRQAYCGWLTCNPKFQLEHEKLWQDADCELLRFGVPVMGPVLGRPERLEHAAIASPSLQKFMDIWEIFLKRWQLAQLPGRGLPLPSGEIWTNLGRRFQPGHLGIAGGATETSFTAPLPPADVLAQMHEDALGRNTAGEHLSEWMKIVAKSNTGKQTLGRYARLFRLQHYWRVLHERYSDACRGRKDVLTRDFAQFFQMGYDTIRDDLKQIHRLLGPDWY